MFFDGIQFIYEGPSGDTVPGYLIGNARAKQTVFSPSTIAMLFPDEYITHVRGRKGAWTDSLEIETNFGRVFSCGGSGGRPFEVKLPANVEVRSISFSLGDHLVNAVAFVGEPLTLANEGTKVLCCCKSAHTKYLIMHHYRFSGRRDNQSFRQLRFGHQEECCCCWYVQPHRNYGFCALLIVSRDGLNRICH